MLRFILTVSLVTMLAACDDAKSSTSDSATAGNTAHAATAHAGHDGACQCGAGKKGETVWCDKCSAGYVDGKKITDKAVYDKAKAGSQPEGDCPCGAAKRADCGCGDAKKGGCDGAKKADCGCSDAKKAERGCDGKES